MFLASISSSSIRRIPRDISSSSGRHGQDPAGVRRADDAADTYNFQWPYGLIHIKALCWGLRPSTAWLRCRTEHSFQGDRGGSSARNPKFAEGMAVDSPDAWR